MSIAIFLKNNLKNIPPNFGQIINKIPYAYRPGLRSFYKSSKSDVSFIENANVIQKKAFIFSRIQKIANYSYSNIQFYKDWYKKNAFNPKDLKIFSDIMNIPIITKSILNEYNIEKRSAIRRGRYKVNTGGSSGTPFSFYIEPSSMGHEWAHMHYIWAQFNYKPSDLKIVFGGRSDINGVVEYDVLRNHFAVNIYADYKNISEKLKIILRKHKIKYLHGYPSSIYDFAMYCKNEDEELKLLLSKNLIGAFLGSEYPQSHYRTLIENTFGIKTISWYGHTERCVLAFEKEEKFVYEPFLSYGYAEAISTESENDSQLISTSYYNYASPLIRYNTEDVISNLKYEDEILKKYKIENGRTGEFVIDKTGKKINLTGLIFGRHHELFNYAKFIQVRQIETGKIEIHFVSNDILIENASKYFDKENLEMDIIFVKRDSPHRTQSGKINLIIK